MGDHDIDELFAFADEARRECHVDAEDLEDTGSLFANTSSFRTRKVRRGRPSLVQLGDGSLHVCFGADCVHAEVDRDKQLVCGLSGYVIGVECTRESDASWTGRSTASANPDDSAGTPVGGWARRRDMFAMSTSAYQSASQINIDEVVRETVPGQPEHGTGPPAPRVSSKRGALCVDEVGEGSVHVASEAAKRQRCALKRETSSKEKLEMEAHAVVGRLLQSPESVDAPASAPAPAPAPTKADPRLQNVDFVRQIALKRYLKQCAEGRALLSMDGVHNVCVAANEFVREQRRAAKAQRNRPARAGAGAGASGSSGQVQGVLSKLVVALWTAACRTPHMTQSRRGSDSFRPFAAGVLYQLKRGLYLDTGVCIIPRVDELAAQLPALRCPNASPAAKQLQSSSHRGICSLHKSIASMAELDAEERARVTASFACAARQSSLLRALVGQQGQS